jgi:hypothetical protein
MREKMTQGWLKGYGRVPGYKKLCENLSKNLLIHPTQMVHIKSLQQIGGGERERERERERLLVWAGKCQYSFHS